METIEDIVREMREGMGWPNPDGRPLTARVQDHLFKIYADRIEESAKQMEMDYKSIIQERDDYYEEVKRLRAMIKNMMTSDFTVGELVKALKDARRLSNESEAK